MTSLNNPVNLPLDSNGYVKSSIWGQNINPNVNTVASVTGAVGSVTGGVGYVNQLSVLSGQSGLSATVSTANAPVNIGTAIAISNNGTIKIEISAHVSGGIGSIRIARTRNGIVDYINQIPNLETSTNQEASLFSDGASVLTDSAGFGSTTRERLNVTLGDEVGSPLVSKSDILELLVLAGDSLQFQVSNTVAGDITYIDDLEVLQ